MTNACCPCNDHECRKLVLVYICGVCDFQDALRKQVVRHQVKTHGKKSLEENDGIVQDVSVVLSPLKRLSEEPSHGKKEKRRKIDEDGGDKTAKEKDIQEGGELGMLDTLQGLVPLTKEDKDLVKGEGDQVSENVLDMSVDFEEIDVKDEFAATAQGFDIEDFEEVDASYIDSSNEELDDGDLTDDEGSTMQKELRCKYCDMYICRSERQLASHVNIAHKSVSKRVPRKDLDRCDRCDFATLAPGEVALHKEKNHEVSECDICGFKTKGLKWLDHHKKTAHRETCGQCKVLYTRGETSETHKCPAQLGPGKPTIDEASFLDIKAGRIRLLNSGEYMCLKCGFKDGKVQILNSHELLMHKNLKCEKCSFIAKGRNKLDEHTKCKHKIKACHICGFVPRNPQNLKAHILKHEKATRPSVTSARRCTATRPL